MANLLHQLQIKGLTGLRIEFEYHFPTVLVLAYSFTGSCGK
jgi:hypothetical protein